MMIERFFPSTIAVLCFLLLPLTGSADAAFNGDISLGVIAIDSGNNLNPSSSKRIIADLDTAADRELSTLPVLLPNLSYSPDTASNVNYFLSTRPPVEEVGGFALGLGVGFSFDQVADIDVAILLAPFGEVWENPYLVGTPRDDTDNSKYGVYTTFDKIFATGLEITLAYYHDDVDNDEIGDLFAELERDGQAFIGIAGYSFRLAESLALTPKFQYIYGDYDGDASTYDRYTFKLGGRYSYGLWSIMPEISYGHTEYDETHPIFGKTRDEDKISFDIIVQYREPFGYENFAVSALAGYSEGDANIEFFDTESMRLGVVLVYQF